MNFIRRFPMGSFNGNLAAGDKISLVGIPQNLVYKAILLKLTNITKAQISKILLTVGVKDIIPGLTGAQLDAINQFNGLNASAGFLMIPFYQRNAATELESRMGELDTSAPRGKHLKYDAFTLEITPDAAHVGAKIEPWAYIDVRKKPAGKDFNTTDLFRAFYLSGKPLQATGDNEFSLTFGARTNFLRQLHLQHANITAFEMLRDTVPYYSRESVAAIQFNQAEFKRVPQGGFLTLDFCENGHELDAMRVLNPDGTLASMKWNAITSAPDLTVQSIADVYTTYDTY